MKLFKRLGGLLLAIVMLLSLGLAACGGDIGDENGKLTGLYIVEDSLKTTYNVGDTFDEAAVRLNAVYERGSRSLTLTSKGVTYSFEPALDMTKAGEYTLTVGYEGLTATKKITVIAVQETLTSLTVKPMKTAYSVGDDDFTAAVILEAAYSTGRTVELRLGDTGVEYSFEPALDMTKAGTYTLTATYGGKEATQAFTVSEGEIVKTLESITVKAGTIASSYNTGDAIDFDAVRIVLHYNTGTQDDEEVALDADGVSYSFEPALDMTAAGTYVMTVTYLGKKVTFTVTVIAPEITDLDLFELPASYSDFLKFASPEGEDEDARDEFMKAAGFYEVGLDNGFRFIPDAQTLNAQGDLETIANLKTDFTLLLGTEGAEGYTFAAVNADDYLYTEAEVKDLKGASEYTMPENYYFFKPSAKDRVFKLEITPDASYTLQGGVNEKIEAVFKVIEGYNVYDQTGLSVLDNLNVNHWKSIKEKAGMLPWDLKPLVEYNIVGKGEANSPVKTVILHDNIVIDPDELPENYFWDAERKVTFDQGGQTLTTDQGYAAIKQALADNAETKKLGYDELLDGSLRDSSPNALHAGWQNFGDPDNGEYAEDYHPEYVNMQKGVYNSSGTGISGNCMTVTYEGEKVDTQGNVIERVHKHNLYTVYDNAVKTSPLSHWSLFKYPDEGVLEDAGKEIVNGGEPVIRNLRITGQSPRQAETYGLPAHLMGFNTCSVSLTLENTIVTQLFAAATGDEHDSIGTDIKLHDSKFFDIYSNMFYVWRANIDVKHCILKEAGGPLFLLCDGNGHTPEGFTDADGPHLYLDSESTFESLAMGQEAWYQLNNATGAFTKIAGLSLLTKTVLGMEFSYAREGASTTDALTNIIAVIMPEPAQIFEEDIKTPNIHVYGSVERTSQDGTKEIFGLNQSMGIPEVDSGIAQVKANKAPILQSGILPTAVSKLPVELPLLAYVSNQDMTELTGMIPAGMPSDAQSMAQMQAVWKTCASDMLFLQFSAAAITGGNLPYIGILIGDFRVAQ